MSYKDNPDGGSGKIGLVIVGLLLAVALWVMYSNGSISQLSKHGQAAAAAK